MSIESVEKALGVENLRDFLEGTWQLTRRLYDRRAGTRGTLEGAAVFEATGGGLIYRETGVLRLNGAAFRAGRVYRYGFPALHCAEISFDDGSPFHVLDLSSGYCRVEHACGADIYRGRYTVAGAGEWRVGWKVVGPRKDQFLESRYVREM